MAPVAVACTHVPKAVERRTPVGRGCSLAKERYIVNIQWGSQGLNLPFQVFSGPVLCLLPSPSLRASAHMCVSMSRTSPVGLSVHAMGWELVAGPWMGALPLWATEHW